MKARDLMRRRVVSVAPGTTLKEAARLLDSHHISGMPVVTSKGDLVGIISRTDILSHDSRGEPGTIVADAMTPWVVSLEEDTPCEELARQMVRKHIHRIVVTRGGRLCGIVTSLDLLRGFMGRAGGVGASISA